MSLQVIAREKYAPEGSNVPHDERLNIPHELGLNPWDGEGVNPENAHRIVVGEGIEEVFRAAHQRAQENHRQIIFGQPLHAPEAARPIERHDEGATSRRITRLLYAFLFLVVTLVAIAVAIAILL